MRIDPMMLLVGAGGAAAGAGAGLRSDQEAAEIRRRQLADQAMRQLEFGTSQAMHQLEFKTSLRDKGYVPVDDAESNLQSAINDPAHALPSASLTPSAAPRPEIAPSRLNAAMLQLVNTPARRSTTSTSAVSRPADDSAFRAAGSPHESFTDPLTGEAQSYVVDPSRTPEARETRQLQARVKAESDAVATREEDRRRVAQEAEEAEIKQVAAGLVASGMTTKDGKPLDLATATGIVRAHKYAPELVKPDANIDPLSPAGVKAAAARAGAEAQAKAPFEADKSRPTDLQARAGLVYDRARDAATIIDQYGLKAPGMQAKLGNVPVVGNFLLPDDLQKLNNAGEVLATAVLRLESGAAISKAEAQSYAKQFLPQPGDSYEVLKQKAQIRNELVDRIQKTAGPALKGAAAPSGAAGVVTPSSTGDSRQSAPLHPAAGRAGMSATPDHSHMTDEEFAAAWRAGKFKRP